MKIKSNLVFILAVLFMTSSFSAESQTKAEKIGNLISIYHEQGKFNGSILVAYQGNIVYKGGMGFANMEWEISNKSNTKHRLGSITKQFTSTLIMQLAEQGKVKLDEPIIAYLPDYPAETGSKITLHHLMTHTSGIPNYTSFPNFFRDMSRNYYSPSDFVKEFNSRPLDFEPGEKYSYSNSGYFLLGAIIEKVTGQSYEDALNERIFKPLDMNDSGYDLSNKIIKNRAAGYDQNGDQFRNTAYIDMSLPYAAGSLYSTVEDLFKWDQALYSEKVLKKASLDQMFTSGTEGLGPSYGYGYDLDEIPVGSTEKMMSHIGHGGGINGFNTIIARFPETKSLVVLLNNTGGKDLRKITSAIIAILHDEMYENPKPSIASAMSEVMDKVSVTGLSKEFEKLRESNEYELNEGDINRLGYFYMGEDKINKAKAIFKFNMETFPNSYNVYDSYAEALMINKEKMEAIKFYKKSIALNPGNQNGKDMLIKLGVNPEDMEKKVEISDEILNTYIGKYELMPGFILTITNEGGMLIAQATGQPSFQLKATAVNRFFVQEVNANLQFNKDDEGKIKSVTLFQGGQEIEGKKMTE